MGELYESLFEITQKDFENVLATVEHQITYLENSIDQVETAGYIASKNYYEYLSSYEEQTIAKLEEEKDALTAAMQEAIDNGIDEGSESFYNMAQEIDSVTEAIQEATTALIEYQNQIRELEWAQFDSTQDAISNVITEADFLLNLLDEDDFYDDSGNLTDTGMAALGLHGQN